MSSATRIKDSFTCRHRGCRWARLACGSSTSGPCFPGPCPCKRFNLIQSPPNWKLILFLLGSSLQQENLVVRILGQPAQQRSCQNDDDGDDGGGGGGEELKHNEKKFVDVFNTCWRAHIQHFQHRSPPVSKDHWKIARRTILEETLPCRILWTPRPSWPCPFFRSWTLPRSFSWWLRRKSLSSELRNLSLGSPADPGQWNIVKRRKGNVFLST